MEKDLNVKLVIESRISNDESKCYSIIKNDNSIANTSVLKGLGSVMFMEEFTKLIKKYNG